MGIVGHTHTLKGRNRSNNNNNNVNNNVAQAHSRPLPAGGAIHSRSLRGWAPVSDCIRANA